MGAPADALATAREPQQCRAMEQRRPSQTPRQPLPQLTMQETDPGHPRRLMQIDAAHGTSAAKRNATAQDGTFYVLRRKSGFRKAITQAIRPIRQFACVILPRSGLELVTRLKPMRPKS